MRQQTYVWKLSLGLDLFFFFFSMHMDYMGHCWFLSFENSLVPTSFRLNAKDVMQGGELVDWAQNRPSANDLI